MSRFDKEYSSYRGRRTLTDILKLVAIVLAVLVGLLLAALWFGRQYLVQTPEGWRLELPFLQRDDRPDNTPTPPDGSVSLPDGSAGADQFQEEPEPEPEPAMAAVELPLSAVLDGTAAAQLEQAGANALVLEMKGAQGQLAWVSEQKLAALPGVNGADPGVNEALRAWNQGQVYTVARVCCFRDNTLPYQRNSVALRAGGGNWRDVLGLRWLAPGNADAQEYLIGLCGELAGLGFDEIVLECAAFPVEGNLDRITSPEVNREQAMAAFLTGVREALAPYDTALSLRVERDVVSGALPGSGLTGPVLEENASRLWMARDGGQPALTQLLTDMGITQAQERLVEVVSQPFDGLYETPQAILGP